MYQATFLIKINDLSPDLTATYLDELKETILDQSPDITVDHYRELSSSQDVFTGLSILLGTKVLVELAKGIADWLRLRNSASITITTSKEKIVIDKLTSSQTPGLVDTILKALSKETS